MQGEAFDFEKQWQGKFSTALTALLGETAAQTISAGGGLLTDNASRGDVFHWTMESMKRLLHSTGREEQAAIMTSCACRYPAAELEGIREVYRRTEDIGVAHEMLQAQFESFLSENLKPPSWIKQEILSRSWGLAGVLDGNRIVATKIPKSSFLEDYFSEPDPVRKRAVYCHCPRIRDAMSAETSVPRVYCYCGAGFYKGIWEDITGETVKVKILSSVLSGDDVCSFEIRWK